MRVNFIQEFKGEEVLPAIRLNIERCTAGRQSHIIVLLTPAMAVELLRMYGASNARRPNETAVEALRQAADGLLWLKYVPWAIGFDINGQIFDGQHRLIAIAKSEGAQWVHMVFGCEPEARVFADRHRKRNLIDAVRAANIEGLKGLKETQLKMACQVARFTMRITSPSRNYTIDPDDTNCLRFVAGYAEVFRETIGLLPCGRGAGDAGLCSVGSHAALVWARHAGLGLPFLRTFARIYRMQDAGEGVTWARVAMNTAKKLLYLRQGFNSITQEMTYLYMVQGIRLAAPPKSAKTYKESTLWFMTKPNGTKKVNPDYMLWLPEQDEWVGRTVNVLIDDIFDSEKVHDNSKHFRRIVGREAWDEIGSAV